MEYTNLFFEIISDKENIYYLPSRGITGLKIKTYNELIHGYAKIFFGILDMFQLEYFVFAGTSVGYVRNQKNIPWVDDYDIMIFEKDIHFLKETILPYLVEMGFLCNGAIFDDEINGGYHVVSNEITNFFLCDIFFSKIDENNNIKNLSGWGLYHLKNVPYEYIMPPTKRMIDDLYLPFFNKIDEDVFLEYGDVINNCVIQVDHGQSNIKIAGHFLKVYENFDGLKNFAIQNTKNVIRINKNLVSEKNKKLVLTSDTDIFTGALDAFNTIDIFELLKICADNISEIYILDQKYLQYCIDVKFYFSEIKIYYYDINDILIKNIFYLNYVDIVKFKNNDAIKNFEKYTNLFFNKPEFKTIRSITFGTYDLFHIGHYNILKRAKKISSELIVGVSSDELNIKKGKKSINNIYVRINDVLKTEFANNIFIEESLEEKDNYIKKYDADLLIMGDDWKGKFDWVSCPTIYLKRTDGISTTLLKNIEKYSK